MAIYLALIRRADFTDLFKYGSILLNRLTMVDYDSSTEVSKEDDILYRLFENANLFESSFTYIIVEFESSNFDLNKPVLNIEDVQNIYPLDMEAKRELETSFDEHIKISNPRWAQSYSIIQKIRTRKDSLKGASNICRLFNIEKDSQDIASIITEDILNEVIDELYRNARPYGELPIWVYLLRYERHAFYPQETVGFFMDTVHVVCNYLSKVEVDDTSVTNTTIFQTLERLPRNIKMLDIFSHLSESDAATDFISKVNEIESRVDFFKIAVIFLFLKSKYQDGLRYEPNIVKPFLSNENTRGCFIFASYLLGIVLGQDKTYEALYESLPLKIYKNSEEMSAIRKQRDYERWMATQEMKRMEEEQQKQRAERNNKQGRKKGRSLNDGQIISEGGRSNQSPFSGSFPKTVPENAESPVKISTSTEIAHQSPIGADNNDVSKKIIIQEKEAQVDDAVPTIGLAKSTERDGSMVADAKGVLDTNGGLSEQTSEVNKESEASEDNTQSTLFPEEEINAEQCIPDFPVTMGKLGKGKGHRFLKTPKPKTANNIEEYQKLYDSGWRIME